MDCTVILGAGFSHAAGLPLAEQLFETETFVTSRGSVARFNAVWRAWDEWHDRHPDKASEQFLGYLYRAPGQSELWAYAVELLGAVLATPQSDARVSLRYSQSLLRPVWCSAQQDFWQAVLTRFCLQGVVTANYDILIERALRHRRMQRPPRPGVYYGGMPRPQILHGLATPWTVSERQREVELTGSVPLCKLHGSLNWSWEGDCLRMYLDLRPAFRRGGDAAIVPPIPEKEILPWLTGIWRQAEECLAQSEVWLVCGYSLPDYDLAVRDMLARSACGGRLSRLIVMDPAAAALRDKWTALTGCECVDEVAGLPEGVDQLLGGL